MHAFLKKLALLFDRINEFAGKAVSWLTAILVLLTCYDVLTRQLDQTRIWVMELEWHLFALIFLIGAGYTFKHNMHVRVDLFYAKFSKRNKAWIDFMGTLLFLIPWTVLIIIFSWQYAYGSFQINETSPDPGGLPARFIIKFSISAGMFLLLLQAFSKLINAYLDLKETSKASESLAQNSTHLNH